MSTTDSPDFIRKALLELIQNSVGQLRHEYHLAGRVYAVHGYGPIGEDIFTVYTVSEDRDDVYHEIEGGIFDHYPSRAEVEALLEQ